VPNNLIIDISSINSAIATVTAIESKLMNTPTNIVGTDAAFVTVNAKSPSQVQIFARTYTGGNKSQFKSSAKNNKPVATLDVSFKGVNFHKPPVILATVGNMGNDHLIVSIDNDKTTANTATIHVTKLNGNDWGQTPREFTVHLLAIGV